MPSIRRLALICLLFLLVACGVEEDIATPPIAPANTTAPTKAPAESSDAPADAPTAEAVVIDTTEDESDSASPDATEEPADEPAEAPTEVPAEPIEVPVTYPPAANLVPGIQLVQVTGGLWNLTNMSHAGDDRIFITGQGGVVWIVQNNIILDDVFIDISDKTDLTDANERGLLDIEFHPNYAENGYFYLNYTDLDGDTVVSRFSVSADNPNRADPSSELIIMTVKQPYNNHNSGHMEFGPDGYLYIAMGDGGSGGDPDNNGQDTGTLLGSILRIDVDSAEPYAIPADNPFVNNDDVRNEIWAYGVRNPWGFFFDEMTGDLYFADVGQNMWEEINFQPAGVGGQNYGWNLLEGFNCYLEAGCSSDNTTLPVFEYSHELGACSVTGGAIYRGDQYPQMHGNYFFGDLCLGAIWAMVSNGDGTFSTAQLDVPYVSSVTFNTDAFGNMYVGDRGTDTLWQIIPSG